MYSRNRCTGHYLSKHVVQQGRGACKRDENGGGTSKVKRRIDKEFVTILLSVSALCALHLELFREALLEQRGAGEDATRLLHGGMSLDALPRLMLAWLVILAILCLLWHDEWVMRLIVRHRVPIGLAAVAVLTLAQVSGSSIGKWANILGYESGQGLLFGTPRDIRADEWVVSTPYALSQSVTGFGTTNPVARGVGTDVTMVYGQPAWAVSTLFRPFLWGYLLLGAARGLAFFWSARLVALFLVTFETCLLVTQTGAGMGNEGGVGGGDGQGDEYLALAGAALITFAPIVQWWFAVNGTADLFIFGQGLVLALRRLLRTRTRASRWGWSLLLAWFCGCYLLVLYPAWQVPLFYVFASMGLWEVFRYRRETPRSERLAAAKKTALPLAASLCLAATLVGLALYFSRETITAVVQTAYPGKRDETGGGLLSLIGLESAQLSTPLYLSAYMPNVCEAARFVSLFPLGPALAVAVLVRRRDRGLAFLLAPYLLLLAYGVFGLPHAIARVLLLSNVQTGRLPMALGYLEVVMLLRVLAVRGGSGPKRGPAIGLSAAFALLCALAARHAMPLAMPKLILLMTLAFSWLAGYLVLAGNAGATDATADHAGKHAAERADDAEAARAGFSSSRGLAVAATFVMLIGLCANPVQMGLGGLETSDFVRAVGQVRSEDPDALWMSDDGICGQALIMEGIRSYAGTHTYPALDLWRSLDPTGESDVAYNRYARVQFEPSDTGETYFEYPGADYIICHISADGLRTLHPTYWISSEDLTSRGCEGVTFSELASAGPNFTIYRIDYS